MTVQLLVTKIAVVNLNAEATTSIPHGLKLNGKGVTPTKITCNQDSTIAVTGFDTMFVTFTNVSSVMATAEFRVEYDGSAP